MALPSAPQESKGGVGIEGTYVDVASKQVEQAGGRTLVDINDTAQGHREMALQDCVFFGAPHTDSHHRIITVRHARVTAACRFR